MALALAAGFGAAGSALGGGWGGVIAVAAMAAIGWALLAPRQVDAPAADSEATLEAADKAEASSARREPKTESERRADEDWRRVADGTAPPSPLEISSASGKRDADWLEL